MTDKEIASKLTPAILRKSHILDQEVILYINSLILEAYITLPADDLKTDDLDLKNISCGSIPGVGGDQFDSIIDFDPEKNPDMSVEDKNSRMFKLLTIMKSERLFSL